MPIVAASAKAAPLPSAASVLANLTQAYGGRTVLDSIKSSSESLSLSLQGQPGTSTTTHEMPNKFVNVLTVPAYHVNMTTGFDGTNGWIKDSYGQVKLLAGDQLATVRCQFNNPIYAMLHPTADVAAAVQPSQTVDGKSYLVLLVSQKGCSSTTLYIDPRTYLVSRLIGEQQTTDLSDYSTGPAGEVSP